MSYNSDEKVSILQICVIYDNFIFYINLGFCETGHIPPPPHPQPNILRQVRRKCDVELGEG